MSGTWGGLNSNTNLSFPTGWGRLREQTGAMRRPCIPLTVQKTNILFVLEGMRSSDPKPRVPAHKAGSLSSVGTEVFSKAFLAPVLPAPGLPGLPAECHSGAGDSCQKLHWAL